MEYPERPATIFAQGPSLPMSPGVLLPPPAVADHPRGCWFRLVGGIIEALRRRGASFLVGVDFIGLPLPTVRDVVLEYTLMRTCSEWSGAAYIVLAHSSVVVPNRATL